MLKVTSELKLINNASVYRLFLYFQYYLCHTKHLDILIFVHHGMFGETTHTLI